jgi:hypothetical protein
LGYVSEGPGTFVAFAFKALGMKRFGVEALPKKVAPLGVLPRTGFPPEPWFPGGGRIPVIRC